MTVAPSSVRTALKRLYCSTAIIAGVAFLLRVALLYLHRHELLGVPGESYGFEAGRVARSLVLGEGFSSPLPLIETGPTAYLCPVYPFLLAGIFRVWGIYTAKSHIAALTLNCALSAATILPIYAIAKRCFGEGTAVLASWFWVIWPDAWHIPLAYVWDSTLSSFWFALIFWATLVIRDRSRALNWAAYGVLWAIGIMINATFLSVLPFFLGWLIWDFRNESVRWAYRLGLTVLVIIVGLAPWAFRNYHVFHAFIPIRSNLGLMLWVGNNPVLVGVDSFALTAVWNRSEAEDYLRMGELPYMNLKEKEALAFMRDHPAATSKNIVRRIGSFWFDVSDRPHNVWSEDPLYVKALFFLNALLILSTFAGASIAWRSKDRLAFPFLATLLVYPVTYYVTCTLVRYRFCIEFMVMILAAYGFEALFMRDLRVKTGQLKASIEAGQ